MNISAAAIFFSELFVLVASICLLIICFRDLQKDTEKLAPKISYVGACILMASLCAHIIFAPPFIDSSRIPLGYSIAWIGFSAGTLMLIVAQIKLVNQNKPLAQSDNTEQINNAPPTTQPDNKPDIYQHIFQGGPASFLVINEEKRILKANLSAANLLNTSIKDLPGQALNAVVYEDDLRILNNLNSEQLANKDTAPTFELRLKHTKGDLSHIQITPQLLSNSTKHILLLLQDISESKRLEELVAFHSNYDELTMLHNRSGLESYLRESLNPANTETSPIALIYVGIDQVKVVNDTCGHSAGDSLIQQLVTIIGETAKLCNFFARLGGDEFALVKSNCSKEEAKDLAESIRSSAEDFVFTWKDNNYRQSVSIGVAMSSPTLNDVISLIGAADSACYTAKKNGRNRVAMYTEGSTETSIDSHKEVMWVSRLQKAIQDGSFILYFQPIEKLSTRPHSHIHYELLIRYIDDNGKHISPAHFLPAVERFGFSEHIDLWVMTTALDYLDKHPEHTEILDCCSINLTTQSIANPRIRSAIIQVVKSYSFPKHKICFEITESSAIHNLTEAQEFVKELKMLGCHLALDDFGTGFASFDYLKHLSVDYLKIDGSFVKDILTDRFDRAMVSAINNIGKEMGIEIIAEYAEDEKILNALQAMEIDYAQGYAIAKPRPIYEIEDYYKTVPLQPPKVEAT